MVEQHKTQPIGHKLIVQNQGLALELFMSHKLLHFIHSLKRQQDTNIINLESGLQLVYLQMNATNNQARRYGTLV